MVKKIEAYQFSNNFKKEFKKLPKEVQKTFEEKLSLFLKNIFHPSLRVKKIQGTKNRWEGSVTQNYRFTFQFNENNLIIFRRIGTHDIFKKSAFRS